MKEYKILWLDENGDTTTLQYVQTDKPKHALFNMLCKMIVICSHTFSGVELSDRIMDWIQQGKMEREHYFAEVNGQVISIIEINDKEYKL